MLLITNIKFKNIIISKLAFFRFARNTILTFKSDSDIKEKLPDDEFLWVNKAVECNVKPMLIEEFFHVEIFNFYQ